MKYLIILTLIVYNSFSIDLVNKFKEDRPYANGKVSFSFLGLQNNYLGEFDSEIKPAWGLESRYTLPRMPIFSFGARYLQGSLGYFRQSKGRFSDEFAEQFPLDLYPDRDSRVSRTTNVRNFELFGVANLFPQKFVNMYAMAGFGVLRNLVEDVQNVPLDPYGGKLAYEDYGLEDEFQFYLVTGIGADVFINRNISVGLQGSFKFLNNDNLDGFAHFTDGNATANDYYFDYGLRFSYYIFQDNDLDGDGISNDVEIANGTNPYSKDTDNDGIVDTDEVNLYKSDPLKIDTDADGLTDYEEIQYKTKLLDSDSDDDGLNDFDEIMIFGSLPLKADSDSDGLSDYDEVFNGLGVLNKDTDGDNYIDGLDECPSVYGIDEGCPGVKTVVKEIFIRDTLKIVKEIPVNIDHFTYRPYGIFFKKNSAEILLESELILDDLSDWLAKNNKVVEIQGHTDDDGAENFNYQLSFDRAKSVKEYLVSQGIDEKRLDIKGFGSEQPIDLSKTSKAKARNRRIEFIIADDYTDY